MDSLVLVMMDSAVMVHHVPMSTNVMVPTPVTPMLLASTSMVNMTVNVTQAMLETEKSVMTSTNAALHHAQPTHHAPTTMDLSLAHVMMVTPVTVNTVWMSMNVTMMFAEKESATIQSAVSAVHAQLVSPVKALAVSMLTNVLTHHATPMPHVITLMVPSTALVMMVTTVTVLSAPILMNASMTNTNVLLLNPVSTLLVDTNAPVVKVTLVSVALVKMLMNVITVHVMPMPSAPIPMVVSNVNVMLDSMEPVNHVMTSMNVLLESMSAMPTLAVPILMVVTNALVTLDSMVTDTFALI